jgi:hypothetical protein
MIGADALDRYVTASRVYAEALAEGRDEATALERAKAAVERLRREPVLRSAGVR